MLHELHSRRHEFDLLHFHVDLIHFPFFEDFAARTVTTPHGRLDLKDLPEVYSRWHAYPPSCRRRLLVHCPDAGGTHETVAWNCGGGRNRICVRHLVLWWRWLHRCRWKGVGASACGRRNWYDVRRRKRQDRSRKRNYRLAEMKRTPGFVGRGVVLLLVRRCVLRPLARGMTGSDEGLTRDDPHQLGPVVRATRSKAKTQAVPISAECEGATRRP